MIAAWYLIKDKPLSIRQIEKIDRIGFGLNGNT